MKGWNWRARVASAVICHIAYVGQFVFGADVARKFVWKGATLAYRLGARSRR